MRQRPKKFAIWGGALFVAGALLVGTIPGLVLARSLSVTKILAETHPNFTRIVIHVSGPTSYRHDRLHNPERLYVDVHGSVLRLQTPGDIPGRNSHLKQIRTAQNSPSVVRVVLDLKKNPDYRVFTLANPFRIVVEIQGWALGVDSPEAKGRADPPNITLVERFKRGLGRIVIDPGHGGKDPGAIGVTGLEEKKVALDIARRLAPILRKTLRATVFLTREKDVFLSLEARTAFANAKKADLFISIHANSSPRSKVRGIETYILREASNRDALETAARENNVSIKKLSDLQIILSDMMLRSKADESLFLARAVHSALLTSVKTQSPKSKDLGIRQAPFYVLLGAEMPSILVETGFISNRKEETQIRSARYRKALALAIAQGVRDFVTGAPITAQAR